MYFLLSVSYWLTLAVGVVAAGFLVRTFIVFHDCTHGSYLPNKKANAWLGRFTGLMVFAAFSAWKQEHVLHHGTSGDLDKRGEGDVMLWTVEEYYSKPRKSRFGYRLFRNPLVMFGVGPIYSLILRQRFVTKSMRARIRKSVIRTNVALVLLIGALCYLIGWKAYVLVQAPVLLLAGAVGVWLFYVQHHFDDVQWERCGQVELPRRLAAGQLLSQAPEGPAVLHRQHRPASRPSPQRAHPELQPPARSRRGRTVQDVPVVSLWDGLRASRFKLWDESARRLVTFAEGRASLALAGAAG